MSLMLILCQVLIVSSALCPRGSRILPLSDPCSQKDSSEIKEGYLTSDGKAKQRGLIQEFGSVAFSSYKGLGFGA